MDSTKSEMDVLRDLAARAVECASRLGFLPATWSTIPTKIMWVVTELEELRVAETSDEDSGLELADIGLRTMGILHVMFPGWSVEVDFEALEPIWLMEPCELLLWPSVTHACRAAQAWRKGRRPEVQKHLEALLVECFRVSAAMGVSLVAQMERKIEINSKRPPLHGTVEALG